MEEIKQITISNGIIPEELVEYIFHDPKIEFEFNLFKEKIQKRIVPELLQVLILSDYKEFRRKTGGSERSWACYLNPKCGGNLPLTYLNQRFSLDLKSAVVFPEDTIFKTTLDHEALHHVFWSHDEDTRAALTKAAYESCRTEFMQEYSHSNNVGQRLVDEYIASWFTREDFKHDKMDPKIMPDKLKIAMAEVGYCTNVAPTIYKSQLEEAVCELLQFGSSIEAIEDL
jgi:hypothetical protein